MYAVAQVPAIRRKSSLLSCPLAASPCRWYLTLFLACVVDQVRRREDAEDEQEREQGRIEALHQIRNKMVGMELDLWRITQEARCASNVV